MDFHWAANLLFILLSYVVINIDKYIYFSITDYMYMHICIWYWLECEMGLSQHKCLNPARAFRLGLDSDTSAEITHLARKPIPYAFSRTLQVF